MPTRARTKVSVYDTPETIYDELARVLTEQTANGHRWICINTPEGVELTFFGVDASPTDTELGYCEHNVLKAYCAAEHEEEVLV